MIRYKVSQLLFFVGTMAPQMIGMVPQGINPKSPVKARNLRFKVEGRIEELPQELRYKIFSPAPLRENPKYKIYKELEVGSVVTGIALNADNTRALTGSYDEIAGIARIWDVEKGTVLKELKGHVGVISSVALSADGTLALTAGSWDTTARVWDTTTGKLLKTLHICSWINSVALSANGALALTGSNDGIARLYNTSTGELLKELKGHTVLLLSVALSADGTLALTGSNDRTACVWNTNTGELLKTLQVGSSVRSVALSADGTLALTGTVGKDVRSEVLRADGTLALKATSDAKVLVWDAKSGALLNTLLTKSSVRSVALSKDGKKALVGTTKNTQVWNTKPLPGQKETSTPLTVFSAATAVAFGDADFIATDSTDLSVLIWQPFTLEPRAPQEHGEVLRQA